MPLLGSQVRKTVDRTGAGSKRTAQSHLRGVFNRPLTLRRLLIVACVRRIEIFRSTSSGALGRLKFGFFLGSARRAVRLPRLCLT